MNKIIIENDIIKEKIIDDNIKINYFVNDAFLSVNNLEIEFLSDTDLYIYYQITQDVKINVVMNCLESTSVNIFEKYTDGILKIRNTYNLNSYSNLNVQKFYDIEKINQYDIVNLNGEHAKFNYVLKTISSEEEKYNLVINHNAPYTCSDIINNAINIDNGKTIFDVTGIVPKGKIGCSLNQNNRIVTFNENLCQINPNLLIDENDVSANHSAFIGKFNDEEIFYLQSRGIGYNEVIKLLIKGFLISNLKLDSQEIENLETIIKKYWG